MSRADEVYAHLQTRTVKHYEVIDKSNGSKRIYKTRNAATRAADRRDNEYGCYICSVRTVYN